MYIYIYIGLNFIMFKTWYISHTAPCIVFAKENGGESMCFTGFNHEKRQFHQPKVGSNTRNHQKSREQKKKSWSSKCVFFCFFNLKKGITGNIGIS